jgi:hypothetical protein
MVLVRSPTVRKQSVDAVTTFALVTGATCTAFTYISVANPHATDQPIFLANRAEGFGRSNGERAI